MHDKPKIADNWAGRSFEFLLFEGVFWPWQYLDPKGRSLLRLVYLCVAFLWVIPAALLALLPLTILLGISLVIDVWRGV